MCEEKGDREAGGVGGSGRWSCVCVKRWGAGGGTGRGAVLVAQGDGVCVCV